MQYRLRTNSVLIAAVLVAVVFTALHADAGVVGTQQVKQLWRTRVGFSCENAPYFDPRNNWLYVNHGEAFGSNHGNMSIIAADSGAVYQSVKTRSQNGESGVALVDGNKVCVNEWNHTVCRNKINLATVWQFGVTGYLQNTPLYVLQKSAVYITFYGPTGGMHKLNAKTGELQATAHFSGTYATYQHPAFSNKYNLVLAGDSSFLTAWNADTLRRVWNYATDSEARTSPIFSDDESIVYFVSGDGTVYALHTASGKLIWQFNFSIPNGASNRPSLHNGVLYVGAISENLRWQGACFAFNAATGKQIWKVTTNVAVDGGNSHVYNNAVLFPYKQGIFALALDGSGVLWKWSNATGSVYAFPAPTGGTLFLNDYYGYTFALQLPE